MYNDITVLEALVMIEIPMCPTEPDEELVTAPIEEIKDDSPEVVRNEVSNILSSLIGKGYVSVAQNGEFYLNNKGSEAGMQIMHLMCLAFRG